MSRNYNKMNGESVTIGSVTRSHTTTVNKNGRESQGLRRVEYSAPPKELLSWHKEVQDVIETSRDLKSNDIKFEKLKFPGKSIEPKILNELRQLSTRKRDCGIKIATLLTYSPKHEVGSSAYKEQRNLERTLIRELLDCEYPELMAAVSKQTSQNLVEELLEFYSRLSSINKTTEFPIAFNRIVEHTQKIYQEKLQKIAFSAGGSKEQYQQVANKFGEELGSLLYSAKCGGSALRVLVARDISPLGGMGNWLPILGELRKISLEKDGVQGWRGECLAPYHELKAGIHQENRKISENLGVITDQKTRIDCLAKDLLDLSKHKVWQDSDGRTFQQKISHLDKFRQTKNEKLFRSGTSDISICLTPQQLQNCLGDNIKLNDVTLGLFFHEKIKLYEAERNLLKMEKDLVRNNLAEFYGRHWEALKGGLEACVESGLLDDDTIQGIAPGHLIGGVRELKELLQKSPDSWEDSEWTAIFRATEIARQRATQELVKLDSKDVRDIDWMQRLVTTIERINTPTQFGISSEKRSLRKEFEKISRELENNISLIRNCRQSRIACFDKDAQRILGHLAGKQIRDWTADDWKVLEQINKLHVVSVKRFEKLFEHMQGVSNRLTSDRTGTLDTGLVSEKPTTLHRVISPVNVTKSEKVFREEGNRGRDLLLEPLVRFLRDRERVFALLFDRKPDDRFTSYLEQNGARFDPGAFLRLIGKKGISDFSEQNLQEILSQEEMAEFNRIGELCVQYRQGEQRLWTQLIAEMTRNVAPPDLDMRALLENGDSVKTVEQVKEVESVRSEVRDLLIRHGCTKETFSQVGFDDLFARIAHEWVPVNEEREESTSSGLISERVLRRIGGKTEEKLKNVLGLYQKEIADKSADEIFQMMLDFKQDDFVFLSRSKIYHAGLGLSAVLGTLGVGFDWYKGINEVMIERQGDLLRVRFYSGNGVKMNSDLGVGKFVTGELGGGGGSRTFDGTQIMFDPKTFPGGYRELCHSVANFVYQLKEDKVDRKFILEHASSMGRFRQGQVDQSLSSGISVGISEEVALGPFSLEAGLALKSNGFVDMSVKTRRVLEKDSKVDQLFINKVTFRGNFGGGVNITSVPLPVGFSSIGLGKQVHRDLVHTNYSILGKTLDPHRPNHVKDGWNLRVGFHQPTSGMNQEERLASYKKDLRPLLAFMPSQLIALDEGKLDPLVKQLIEQVDGRDKEPGMFLMLETGLKREQLVRIDRLSTELELLLHRGLSTQEDKRQARKLSQEIDKIVGDSDNYFLRAVCLNAMHEGYGSQSTGVSGGLGSKTGMQGKLSLQSIQSNWHETQNTIARVDLEEKQYGLDDLEKDIPIMEDKSDGVELAPLSIEDLYSQDQFSIKNYNLFG